jgi:hypothetical protein
MPVDKPKSGETKEDYLAYCIPAEINAGKEKDVAAAICISTYDRAELSKIKDTKEKVMARVAYDSKYEGINLVNLGENSDACWENYIQVGTKILDGREVPDCRGPVETE